MSVSYMTHPLIRHKITLLRKEDTSTNEFRKLVEEIAMLMGYEALSDLETQDITVKTPIEESVQPVISGKKLAVVPILRAGLGMVNGILALVPSARVGHIVFTVTPKLTNRTNITASSPIRLISVRLLLSIRCLQQAVRLLPLLISLKSTAVRKSSSCQSSQLPRVLTLL